MKKLFYIISYIFLLAFFSQSCEHVPNLVEETVTSGCGVKEIVEKNTIPRDTDTVYFQNDIYPILLSRCALSGCHIGDNLRVSHNEEIILCSYDEIINWENDEGEKLIIPFNTHDGKILEQITSTDIDHMMPPLPHEPLTNEQIDRFITWVQQGALNNKCEK